VASHGCTTACWLIVPPALDVPTLATRYPRAYRRVPHSSGGSWNLWAGIRTGKFCLNADFHGTFRVLLHAANLRHGTHGFTSLPKEGVLRIFPPLKIRRFRPGLNPRTWVPEASTLTPRPPKPLITWRTEARLVNLCQQFCIKINKKENNKINSILLLI
jgi:hypothetical protein